MPCIFSAPVVEFTIYTHFSILLSGIFHRPRSFHFFRKECIKALQNNNFSAELQLYRWLGVPQFRKLILAYARLRHCRRGGRNPNYHLKGLTMTDVEAFLPQLRRNVKLHILSLMLLALFWAAAAYENISCPEAIPITLFLLWLNIWCLMLQRYHYLRIRQLQEKHFRLRNPEKP